MHAFTLSGHVYTMHLRIPVDAQHCHFLSWRPANTTQVLAQLLSSALYYMADETELTHIIRLRPNEDIGPCLLPDCNALLVRSTQRG
jgi:hypothetical protein